MTRSNLICFVTVLALLVASATWAADYAIDPAHSSVSFKIRHMVVSSVTGRFGKFSGSFSYDPKNLKASKAEAKIDAAGINTDNEKRDGHLRSADFFDVEKFPDVLFVSREIKDVKKDHFKIAGDLTLHGVTKSVTLDAEAGGTITDPGGNIRAGFSATTTINRKDYGIVWNKALEAGGATVGEDVKITLEIEGIQKKEMKDSKDAKSK